MSILSIRYFVRTEPLSMYHPFPVSACCFPITLSLVVALLLFVGTHVALSSHTPSRYDSRMHAIVWDDAMCFPLRYRDLDRNSQLVSRRERELRGGRECGCPTWFFLTRCDGDTERVMLLCSSSNLETPTREPVVGVWHSLLLYEIVRPAVADLLR